MNEQRLNDFLGDNEDKNLGTGWWANVLSTFFGALAFGGVLCLYFPQQLNDTRAARLPAPNNHAVLQAEREAARIPGLKVAHPQEHASPFPSPQQDQGISSV